MSIFLSYLPSMHSSRGDHEWGDEDYLDPLPEDWHERRDCFEPACGPLQWRTKNRREVIDICRMTDHHLRHALKFARYRKGHKSKLEALASEWRLRCEAGGYM